MITIAMKDGNVIRKLNSTNGSSGTSVSGGRGNIVTIDESNNGATITTARRCTSGIENIIVARYRQAAMNRNTEDGITDTRPDGTVSQHLPSIRRTTTIMTINST